MLFWTYFRCLGALPSSALPTSAFLQFRLNDAKERMTRQVYTVFGWFLTISFWYLSCHGFAILTMYLSEIVDTVGILAGSKRIVLKISLKIYSPRWLETDLKCSLCNQRKFFEFITFLCPSIFDCKFQLILLSAQHMSSNHNFALAHIFGSVDYFPF
jgi:hypothetical protein